MIENRLAQLIESKPDIKQKINLISNKNDLMLFLSKYIPDYTEDEAYRNLSEILNLVELNDEDCASVSGGAMVENKESLHLKRVLDEKFVNTIKKWKDSLDL